MPELPDWGGAPVTTGVSQILIPLGATAYPGSFATVVGATAGQKVVIMEAALTYDLTAGLAPANLLLADVTVIILDATSLVNILVLGISPAAPLASPPIVFGAVAGGLSHGLQANFISEPGAGTIECLLQVAYTYQSS